MESLCKIRDLYRAIIMFENEFQTQLDISLNEGMALCTLKSAECLSSGQLAEQMGLSYSNTSKVIKTLEKKKLIARCIGHKDKRQMLFSITEEGQNMLFKIKQSKIQMPKLLADSLKSSADYNKQKNR